MEVYIQGAWLRPCISSLNEANVVCQHFGMTNALQVTGSSASPVIPPTVFELDCSDDSVDCVPSTQNWFPSFDMSSECSNTVNYSVTCQSKHCQFLLIDKAKFKFCGSLQLGQATDFFFWSATSSLVLG